LAFARKVFFSKRKGKNKNVYSSKQVASSVGSTKSTG
jgi:hypothetical protein